MTDVAVPFRFDNTGRTVGADADRHVLDLIELVLMTAAGERVNRPDFGSGVPQLVFAPGGDAVAATVKYLVQGALQQWLSDRILVQDVTVTATEGVLDITVMFLNRLTQIQETVTFQPPAVVP